MRLARTIPRLLLFIGCVLRGHCAGESSSVSLAHEPRGGFTGPQVPTAPLMLGDYCQTGVRTPEGRTDIPKLIRALREMKATDYMHLVWRAKNYPHAWEDFQAMAPEFQKAGIRLWLYLTPPSETPPAPFGNDYVRWAKECAALARQFPVVQGLTLDDFNGNVKTFTADYCRQMMTEAHKVAPTLSLYVICYYGYADPFLAPHVRTGAIDGIIWPYFHPHKNHTNTTDLFPQAAKYRAWLDAQTQQGGLPKSMPLIVMVYGSKMAKAREACTPAYVQECLKQGLRAVAAGYADGVMTYCLPKDKPAFVEAARQNYANRQDKPLGETSR